MAAKRCKYCKNFKEIEVDISPSPFDGVCTNREGRHVVEVNGETHIRWSLGYAYSGGRCDKFERREKRG